MFIQMKEHQHYDFIRFIYGINLMKSSVQTLFSTDGVHIFAQHVQLIRWGGIISSMHGVKFNTIAQSHFKAVKIIQCC